MKNLIKIIGNGLLNNFESIFGKLDAWDRHRSFVHSMPTVHKSIEYIKNRWEFNDGEDEYRPIFIFSAGWRSGSTLLQRLVNSSENILIWGEPYKDSDYIRKLADSLRFFNKTMPPKSYFIEYYIDPDNNKIIDQWTACLFPTPNDLKNAHRQFFLSLFSEPSKNLGFSNWGIKEVRLGIEYAYYLKWLFPNSKFIFLFRNPYEAYNSYRSFGRWYDSWPNRPVFTARSYGFIWRNLLEGYILHHKNFDSLLISYENLISGVFNFEKLSTFLGKKVNAEILQLKYTGRDKSKLKKLSYLDRKLLSSKVEPLASKLGYNQNRT
jgi:hypothetical protein